MHAQLRISTTTKDTKSAKLARPAEALKNPNTQLIAAGFLLPGLGTRRFAGAWLVLGPQLLRCKRVL